ncbi:MAG: hypothetical protein LBJ42_00995 [Holosporales bacterium]|jgi:hypothetical protein|nr:hypothetical protein [Holosporales bacterium]
MTNISHTLHKRIVLLEDNIDTTATTVSMYNEILPTRGSIVSMGRTDGDGELYEIVIIKPPPKFESRRFSAVLCDGERFKFKTHLRNYMTKYLRCIAKKT